MEWQATHSRSCGYRRQRSDSRSTEASGSLSTTNNRSRASPGMTSGSPGYTRDDKQMIALSPALLISAAYTYMGRGDEAGEDIGQRTRDTDHVDLFLRNVHPLSETRASAAFMDHVGYWSHYEARGSYSAWPLPMGGTCDDIAKWAIKNELLSDSRVDMGDLFLVWSPLHKQFARVGIVLELMEDPWLKDGCWWFDCLTLEGLAGAEGEPPWWSYRARRRLSP